MKSAHLVRKFSLSPDDVIVYVEIPKESATKEKSNPRITGFTIFIGYKVNIQKSMIFLYTTNVQMETEI